MFNDIVSWCFECLGRIFVFIVFVVDVWCYDGERVTVLGVGYGGFFFLVKEMGSLFYCYFWVMLFLGFILFFSIMRYRGYVWIFFNFEVIFF